MKIAHVGDYITKYPISSAKVVHVTERYAYVVAGVLHAVKHGTYQIDSEESANE